MAKQAQHMVWCNWQMLQQQQLQELRQEHQAPLDVLMRLVMLLIGTTNGPMEISQITRRRTKTKRPCRNTQTARVMAKQAQHMVWCNCQMPQQQLQDQGRPALLDVLMRLVMLLIGTTSGPMEISQITRRPMRTRRPCRNTQTARVMAKQARRMGCR